MDASRKIVVTEISVQHGKMTTMASFRQLEHTRVAIRLQVVLERIGAHTTRTVDSTIK